MVFPDTMSVISERCETKIVMDVLEQYDLQDSIRKGLEMVLIKNKIQSALLADFRSACCDLYDNN